MSITIKGKDYDEYSELENIERIYLKSIEFDCSLNEFDNQLQKLFSEFSDRSIIIFKYLGEFEGEYLFKEFGRGYNNFILLDFLPVKNVGECIIYDEDKFKEINLNLEEINNLLGLVTSDEYEDVELKIKEIENINAKEIKEKLKEKLEIHKRELEIAEQEKIEEEEEEKKKKEEYIKNGKLENYKVKIDDKTISDINNSDELELNKKINEVFSYDRISDYNDIEAYERLFIYDKIDFKFKNKDIQYEVSFNPTKLNGVEVEYVKLRKLIEKLKMKKDITASLNKNKLPQIFYNFLKIDKIAYSDVNNTLNIPLKVTCLDEKKRLFELEFLGVKKQVDWNFAKDYFVYGFRIYIDLNWDKLIRFFGEFGFDKNACLDYLRKARTLKNLKGE